MVSSPKAPDPVATAAAQSGSNRDTATSSQLLNMTNQVGPNGTLTYNQTGQNSYVDSLTGKTVYVPQFTATTTLSPAQQAIQDQTNATSLNLGKLANQQSSFLQNYLATPYQAPSDFTGPGALSNHDVENWAYDIASQRILPQQQKDNEALRAQLTASGIRPGTAAYNGELQRLTNANTDQLNQLALTGRQQAVNEQNQNYNQALQNYTTNLQKNLTARNQPINEISSLLGGSQVQQPNFVNTPQTNVGGVDYTGLVNQKYQSELQASQARMGGLFGLASAGIGLLSDVRVKTDITRVGSLDNGLPVYLYRYVGSPEFQIGLMAQEVEQVIPEAVHTGDDGLKRVRYDIAVEAA